jgi:uncharacterized repeat protein (TIGR03803 family)
MTANDAATHGREPRLLRAKFVFSSSLRQKLFLPLALSLATGMLFVEFQNKADAQLTILHSFGDGTVPADGANPFGGLVQAPDGDFFGVTVRHPRGAVEFTGAVFRMTPAGVLAIVQDYPHKRFLTLGGPLLSYNGGLVGITASGPKRSGTGAIFRLKLWKGSGLWRTTFWYKFGPIPFGPLPGTIIVGREGNLYGTIPDNGTGDAGTIYKFDPTTHQFTTLHNFPYDSAGTFPSSALVLAKDDNFYGTTASGPKGANGSTIFVMTPKGKVTTLYTFTDGSYLGAPLIQGTDGNFYGMTQIANTGSPTQYGIVFKMTPDNVVTILHTFGNGNDGTYPWGTVVQGANGNLYGTTELGGTAGHGVIFEVTTDGSSYTVLHNFGDGSVVNDGTDPQCSLIVGSDSNLYGTTSSGGSANFGVVFRFSP